MSTANRVGASCELFLPSPGEHSAIRLTPDSGRLEQGTTLTSSSERGVANALVGTLGRRISPFETRRARPVGPPPAFGAARHDAVWASGSAAI